MMVRIQMGTNCGVVQRRLAIPEMLQIAELGLLISVHAYRRIQGDPWHLTRYMRRSCARHSDLHLSCNIF